MGKGTNNKETRREEALGRFMGTIAEINERLSELREFADDHMGLNPDEINWGHVGTAERFLKGLTEFTDMAYSRGEFAK